MIGQVVVVDLRSSYVCLGTLAGDDEQFLEMLDADLHDFRDSTATREIYVYDSVRYGIRRNRSRDPDPPGRRRGHQPICRYRLLVTILLVPLRENPPVMRRISY